MAGTPQPPPSSPAPAKGAEAVSGRSSESTQALTITIPVSSSCFGVGGGRDRPTFSQLLAGAMASPAAGSSSPMIAVPVVAVPCFITPAGLLDSPGITGQFAMTHQAVLATVTAHAQMQLQAGYASPSSNPFPQPVLSPLSPVPIKQRPPPKPENKVSENKVTPAEPEQSPTSEQKPQSTLVGVKTTSSDGYNWRKYGQKQVKSSESTRSYYKCTQANCLAKKKVEFCSDGRVTEICYRGDHNHEPPPQKAKCSKERRSQAATASKEDENLESPTVALANLDNHLLKIEENSQSETAEQLHCSNDCEGDPGLKANREADDEPEAKKRNIESPMPYSTPLLKTFKEPKVIVQAANDEGSASDGYRWRKYGQKIVKGNPNPRSYYKCTHMGCPVRKHVERACEDAKAVIITYEGKHNHDIPPPRNGNGSSPPALPTGDAGSTVTSHEKMEESNSSCKEPLTDSQPQDKEVTGERAPETDSEKKELQAKANPVAMGYEPTSAEDKGGTPSSDAIERPLFDGNLPVVPVHNS